LLIIAGFVETFTKNELVERHGWPANPGTNWLADRVARFVRSVVTTESVFLRRKVVLRRCQEELLASGVSMGARSLYECIHLAVKALETEGVFQNRLTRLSGSNDDAGGGAPKKPRKKSPKKSPRKSGQWGEDEETFGGPGTSSTLFQRRLEGDHGLDEHDSGDDSDGSHDSDQRVEEMSGLGDFGWDGREDEYDSIDPLSSVVVELEDPERDEESDRVDDDDAAGDSDDGDDVSWIPSKREKAKDRREESDEEAGDKGNGADEEGSDEDDEEFVPRGRRAEKAKRAKRGPYKKRGTSTVSFRSQAQR
jgi:hypothetical protein